VPGEEVATFLSNRRTNDALKQNRLYEMLACDPDYGKSANHYTKHLILTILVVEELVEEKVIETGIRKNIDSKSHAPVIPIHEDRRKSLR